MFNVYKFDQSQNDMKQHLQNVDNQVKLNKSLLEKREKFSQQYNERIASFVKNMLVNPVKIQREQLINQTYDPDFRFKRSVRLDSSQIMKRPTKEMRFASNNLERIKEAIDRNKNLSSDPTDMHNGQTQESILNLRPFDKSKVINQSNPSFKFKPATSIERVYETIQNSRNLAPSDLADKTLLNNRSTKKLQLKSQNLNKTLNVPSYSVSPREMHKGLHQKTHFKAVYEMFVNPVYGDRVKDESLKKAKTSSINYIKIQRSIKLKLQ